MSWPWPTARITELIRVYAKRWDIRVLRCNADGSCPGAPIDDQRVRLLAISEACRWGEPVFVPAPGERLCWAVPVQLNNTLLGGLVALAPERAILSDRQRARLLPTDLRLLAEEANLANAAALELQRRYSQRERVRAEAIHTAKHGGGRAEVHAAFLRQESALVAAIRRGDEGEARRLLNTVLVVVYGEAKDDLGALKAFALELVTTMVRTAIEGGAPTAASAAGLSRLADLADLGGYEDIARWLSATMRDLMSAIAAARTPPADLAVDEALRIMRSDFRLPLTRDGVARRCGMSPAHFSRVFAARHGEPFATALARMRCAHAADLLAAGDRALADIALECGFSDQSLFGKVFRRLNGFSPGAWRRR